MFKAFYGSYRKRQIDVERSVLSPVHQTALPCSTSKHASVIVHVFYTKHKELLLGPNNPKQSQSKQHLWPHSFLTLAQNRDQNISRKTVLAITSKQS